MSRRVTWRIAVILDPLEKSKTSCGETVAHYYWCRGHFKEWPRPMTVVFGGDGEG